MDTTMGWLLEYAAQKRAVITKNKFFRDLDTMDEKAIRGWLPSLQFFSLSFIQALMMRAARCHQSSPMWRVFLRHASHEGEHPEQLTSWMRSHDFSGSKPSIPTPETEAVANICMWSAVNEVPDRQVTRLNIAGEGFAFDFFTRAIPVIDRLGLNDSPYWEAHHADNEHMRYGVDLMIPMSPDGPLADLYRGVIDSTSVMFDRMFLSWHDSAVSAR